MATLSPSGSNRTRLSAAASFHYRRPRRRPDTRSGLSIHTLTTPRDGPCVLRASARPVVPRPGERTGGVPRRRKTERGVTLTVDYLLCSDSAICAGAFVRSTESGFSFRLSYVPQHSESDTAADRCSLHAARAAPWSRFLAVLTSVSTFRLEFSGLGPRGFAR